MGLFDFTRKNKYGDFEDVEDEPFGGYGDDDVIEEDDEPIATPVAPAEPAAPSFGVNHASLKITNPKSYEDAREITEFLMNGNIVILNMDGIAREAAVRVIDYLRGAIQVVGGMMKKVGKTTLIIAPKNVDVSSIEAMVGNTGE